MVKKKYEKPTRKSFCTQKAEKKSTVFLFIIQFSTNGPASPLAFTQKWGRGEVKYCLFFFFLSKMDKKENILVTKMVEKEE